MELRKDYILDRYVVISEQRGKRPHEFREEGCNSKKGVCYFCPGNEHLTPEELARYPKGKKWVIRVFPNKFPAFEPRGNSKVRTENEFFTFSPSYGYHNVIVDTPNHEKQLWDMGISHIKLLLRVFSEQVNKYAAKPNINYVMVFKNHGREGGTSIKHSHCQMIALSKIPPVILEKEKSTDVYIERDGCPYCSVIEIEKKSSRRCYENKFAVAFTPYASRFSYEIWLFPKKHVLRLDELGNKELEGMAEIFKKILLKLKSINASYNFYLHYGVNNLHLHFIIAPRLNKWAGFELGSGIIINPVPPEEAARFYRG